MTRSAVVARHGVAGLRRVAILPPGPHVIDEAPVVSVTMATAWMPRGTAVIPFASVQIVVRPRPTPVIFRLRILMNSKYDIQLIQGFDKRGHNESLLFKKRYNKIPL